MGPKPKAANLVVEVPGLDAVDEGNGLDGATTVMGADVIGRVTGAKPKAEEDAEELGSTDFIARDVALKLLERTGPKPLGAPKPRDVPEEGLGGPKPATGVAGVETEEGGPKPSGAPGILRGDTDRGEMACGEIGLGDTNVIEFEGLCERGDSETRRCWRRLFPELARVSPPRPPGRSPSSYTGRAANAMSLGVGSCKDAEREGPEEVLGGGDVRWRFMEAGEWISTLVRIKGTSAIRSQTVRVVTGYLSLDCIWTKLWIEVYTTALCCIENLPGST